MNLAVVLPSRGLIFSETIEELYRELDSVTTDWADSYTVFFSHSRPIPDCFNIPTEEALLGNFTHILYVEEDMVLPVGVLGKMLNKKAAAVTCDYPVAGGSGGTILYDQEGRVLFSGTGMLLVETALLRRLPKPIFRTDIQWKPLVEDGLIYFSVTPSTDTDIYGHQDVAFGLRLYANGIPLVAIEETLGQRELIKRGGKGANDAFHVVVDRMDIVPRHELAGIPVRRQFNEIVIDGKRVKVSETHLKKLTNVEYPDYVKVLSAVFDVDESLRDWVFLKD